MQAVRQRQGELPTFSGDFFVYSDIFSEGRPAYWSGYFGTRPYWKKFYRETENALRSAEMLYTLAFNVARQSGNRSQVQLYAQEYSKLIVARQWLALFAHHDATTGTSKTNTMDDYGLKLMEANQISTNIQMSATNTILFGWSNATAIYTDYELSSFGVLPRKIPLKFINRSDRKELVHNVVLFNNLSWKRTQYVKVVVATPNVQVFGPDGNPVISQVTRGAKHWFPSSGKIKGIAYCFVFFFCRQLNPILDTSESGPVHLSSELFELVFLAELSPLSLSTFKIRRTKPKSKYAAQRALVYCRNCTSAAGIFEINKIQVKFQTPLADYSSESCVLILVLYIHSMEIFN